MTKKELELHNNFLMSYITQMVQDTLSGAANSGKTDHERYQMAMKDFASLKFSVQDSVSSAFSRGMHLFSGQEIDYFCIIGVAKDSNNLDS